MIMQLSGSFLQQTAHMVYIRGGIGMILEGGKKPTRRIKRVYHVYHHFCSAVTMTAAMLEAITSSARK